MEAGQSPGFPSRDAASDLSAGAQSWGRPMAPSMRTYSPRDRDHCLRIFDSNRPRSFADYERAQFESYLDSGGGTYFIVERRGAVVGCGGYAISLDGKTADLCWGMIEQRLHRERLGELLLLGRLQAIAALGRVAGVRLSTSQFAEGFYAQYGFKAVSRVADGFGTGLDRVEMRLDLTVKVRTRVLESWRLLGQNMRTGRSLPRARRKEKPMTGQEQKVECRTPMPGSQGTRIPKWKYDAVREAIRAVVPRTKEGIEFRSLATLVAKAMPVADRRKFGSVAWHTTTVKLHMEVIGELARVPDSRPQRLRLIR